MNSKTAFAAALAILLAATVSSSGAFAQDSAAPASRAEIKAETRAAEKAGKLIPAGEGSPVDRSLNSRSTKTRVERKAETRQARKSGDLIPAGEVAGVKAQRTALSSKTSTKTRAERKTEVRADAKAGRLIPAGEGPTAPSK